MLPPRANRTATAPQLRWAAYHEAAHGVARIWVGSEATAVEVRATGEGMSHGTGEIWSTPGGGQYEVWDQIIVCLAGPWAEARIRKVATTFVLANWGRKDYCDAERNIKWLVENGFATSTKAAWTRAETETRDFLRKNWPEIEKVAVILVSHGRLEAAELRRIVPGRQYQPKGRLRSSA